MKIHTGSCMVAIFRSRSNRASRPPAANALPHITKHTPSPAGQSTTHRRVLALVAHSPPCIGEGEGLEAGLVSGIDGTTVLWLRHLLPWLVVLVVFIVIFIVGVASAVLLRVCLGEGGRVLGVAGG